MTNSRRLFMHLFISYNISQVQLSPSVGCNIMNKKYTPYIFLNSSNWMAMQCTYKEITLASHQYSLFSLTEFRFLRQDPEGHDRICFKKVAVVEDFFDIIYNLHVCKDGKEQKHMGQKRTYRAVSKGLLL